MATVTPSSRPHINLPAGIPGIVGPMIAYPETEKPLNQLAELLLTAETPTFTKAERETVAAYVSYLNRCLFCSESHAAVADFHWRKPVSKLTWEDPANAPISDRLRAQLRIAAKVQQAATTVTRADVEAAQALGCTERDIHDTVLIAAAFCMFNRYVDGLGTVAPPAGHPSYAEMGRMLGEGGYTSAIGKMQR